MANYQWNFSIASPHTVLVEHPFKGDVVIHLDGKEIHRHSGRELEYEFEIEGKPCLLSIRYETKSYGGIAAVQTWTHHLCVDGEYQELSSRT